MSRSDPCHAEHQRRWLRPDWQHWVRHDAHRFLPPEKFEAKSRAVASAADMVSDVDWEAMRDDLLHLRRQVKDLRSYLVCRRLGFKYEGQPRDDHGRYAEGRLGVDSPKDPGLITRPAFLGPAIQGGLQVGRIAILKGIEAALTLYAAMSARNARDSTAVLEFNASLFKQGASPEDDPAKVGNLTEDEVKKLCPKYEDVQRITNWAAEEKKRENYGSAAAYGTAVHQAVEQKIDALADPNFRAEVSAIKSEEEGRGVPGTRRIDVLENTQEGAVCIYDIKTGKSGLSARRALELVQTVQHLYGPGNLLVVTEVRPRK